MQRRHNKMTSVTVITIFLIGVNCGTPGSKSVRKGVWKLIVISPNGHVEIRPDKKKYANGEKVTLTAYPDSGYSFLNWFGTIYGTRSGITVTMNGNQKIYAGYVKGTLGAVSDIDGFVYRTLKIGDRVWTIDNLRTTKLNDGTPIPYVVSDSAWYKTEEPAYCFYEHNRDTVFQAHYGALYNWFAVGTGKLAPEGWHVANDSDWLALAETLCLDFGTGKRPAEVRSTIIIAGNSGWRKCRKPFYSFRKEHGPGIDLSRNNGTGFSALPGGFRSEQGTFGGFTSVGWWWRSNVTVKTNWYDDFPPLKNKYEQPSEFELILFLYSCGAEAYSLDESRVAGVSVRLVQDLSLEINR